MLYHLLYPLKSYFFGFNVFRYITFRSAAAAIMALFISFYIGPIVIRYMRRKQIGEKIDTDGPESHQVKAGTPTFGGIIILIAVVVPTVLFARLNTMFTWVILIATIFMAIIGFIDDYLKIVKKYPKGLVGRYKLAGQIILGLFLGLVVWFSPVYAGINSETFLPFFKNYVIDLGIFIIPVAILVIMATSNSVNLTDGLDGLAVGLVGISAIAWAVISYISGRTDFTVYLDLMYLKDVGELTVYCSAMLGACIGFLWFNSSPAEIFMGDVGSLTLGGALGTLAILTKKEIMLLVIGGVFVIESLSVILQVLSFRYRGGKRIFLMAPLHHHFELKGIPEQKIVVRFWIVGILLLLFSLSLFKVR